MDIDLAALETLGRQMTQGAPQAAALGLQFVSVAPGVSVLKVPYGEALVGDPATGVIAGGVITTLLDHTCGVAIKSVAFDMRAPATLDLRIDYMRAAEPRRDVFARAHCYKVTRTIAFVRAEAYETSPEDPIATAQAAFVLSGAPA